jgi:ParB family chromosome partitioning protein
LRRPALGRGLSQLLADQFSDGSVSEVDLEAIQPNSRQPRRQFDSETLQELADSIAVHGVLQPILLRPIAENQYEIIAGERRWRAAQQAGLTRIPAVIRAADARSTLELALIENIQREDITPLEAAHAYQGLIEEFGLTQEEIAERTGKSRVAIANTLRLMRLPEEVRQALQSRAITEGHARALLGLGSETAMEQLSRKIITEGLSVRQVEAMVKGTRPSKEPKPQPAPLDPNSAAIVRALEAHLSVPVKLDARGEKGRLVLSYRNDEELTNLLDRLGVTVE